MDHGDVVVDVDDDDDDVGCDDGVGAGWGVCCFQIMVIARAMHGRTVHACHLIPPASMYHVSLDKIAS